MFKTYFVVFDDDSKTVVLKMIVIVILKFYSLAAGIDYVDLRHKGADKRVQDIRRRDIRAEGHRGAETLQAALTFSCFGNNFD